MSDTSQADVTISMVMGREYRDETIAALNDREEALEKLAKKEQKLGIDTSATERSILRTKEARRILIGQGDAFEGTAMEVGPLDSDA